MYVNYLGANNSVRCIGVDSKEVLQKAIDIHGTEPVASAAFGRTLSAGLILTSHLKNETDLLTLQIRGDGPIGSIVVVANVNGKIKGYVENPKVNLPLKNNKLDVGKAVGHGNITLVKDLGLKEPYVGTSPLMTGEIAEDLAYYLAVSEQIPSVISLGVLVKGYEVLASGGIMIQPLPNTEEAVLDELERRALDFPEISSLLSAGATIDDILNDFMRGFSMEKHEVKETAFECNCSRERLKGILASISSEELQEMIDDGEGAQVKCHFCNSNYDFNTEELIAIKEGNV